MISEAVGTVAVIFGFGISQGRMRERMRDLSRQVERNEKTISAHTASLAEGEGNFKVIDTKLDYISRAVENMVKKLDRQ